MTETRGKAARMLESQNIKKVSGKEVEAEIEALARWSGSRLRRALRNFTSL